MESNDNKNINFLWSQLENFSSYGFNKSHAVAYTFTSSRLLYLKAHYPLEFFCSTLALEGDEDKVKVYKREAERMGIKINRCDLNKSGVNYEIIDDEIYVGFSNIKGIGEDIAKRIVSLKPYSGLEDFLVRFGTDKRVVEPLINLGAFKECEPHVAWEFYEEYKKWTKGFQDKEKRQAKRREELLESIKSMLSIEPDPSLLSHESVMAMGEGGVGPIARYLAPEFSKEDVHRLVKKYVKSALDYEHKENFSKSNPISLENWKATGKYAKDWPNVFELERKHYGFSWNHPIQKSGGYMGGHSFSMFKDDDDIVTGGVEVMVVKKPQEKVSKNGNKYHFVLVEDEDWNVEVVTFWSEDYARFKEELNYWDEKSSRGHFLRMRVTRPGSNFKSYTFDSPPKKIRYKVIPQDKEMDARLQVMDPPS
jgi:DNA polymerase III alpha subunit